MPLILGTNSIKDTGYDVANSLRYDGSSAYLNRTVGAGNRQTWTWSGWIKRSTLGTDQCLFDTYVHGNDNFRTNFADTDKVSMRFYNGTEFQLGTQRRFRDTSAWVHLVFVADTTNGTEADRFRIYVNGVRETSLSDIAYPTQNLQMSINDSNTFQIGRRQSTNYFDGYMAEVVFIDGQALDADSFGEFDEDSPTIWKPKDVSSLTFGTNGFHLDFEDSSSLGNDSAGSNNFTSNNLATTDQSTDTCTNNFANMNPLASQGGSNVSNSVATFSEGNLVVDAISSESVIANIGVDTGKWYWEVKVLTDQDGLTIGGVNQHFHLDAEIGFNSPSSPSNAKVFGYYGGNGNKVTTIGDGSQFSSYGNAISVNDIIGVALNLDDDEVTFYLNGTAQNSGTAISLTALGSGEQYFPAVGNWSASAVKLSFNFGSPHHSVSSGNSDGNGYGNFEYTVPSGYYALNTKNLSEYG